MQSQAQDENHPHQLLSALDLKTLIESSDQAVFSRTLDNRVVSWSRGAERLFGFSRAQMIGREILCLFPLDRIGEAADLRDRIAAGERIEGWDTVRLTQDGRLVAVVLTISPLRDESGAIIGALTVASDIIEQEQAEEILRVFRTQVENKALVLETAHRVSLDILAHRTGVEALRHIAEAARTLAGARYAALGVADPGGKGLQDFVTVGLTEDEEAAIGPRPKGKGVLGLLLDRTDPLRVDSLKDHPASVEFPPGHPPMNSFLGVPIRRGDVILGSLYLTEKEGGQPFTEADEAAVQALGAHAAIAIHTMQMLTRQRALVSGLIHAQEEERRAVAYDLHDGLTQYVMASYAHLEAFRRAHAAGKQEKADRELEQGLRGLKEAVVESRRLVNGLRTLALDDLGLAGALEQILMEEKERAGWQDADLAHNVAGRRFDKTLETAAYRVAQEALTNARKHARAARVRVLLLEEQNNKTRERHLTLEVRDWGCGFAPEQMVDAREHVGMQSMIERVRLLDGQYEIRSKPGDGCVIRAVFPVVGPSPDEKEDGEKGDAE